MQVEALALYLKIRNFYRWAVESFLYMGKTVPSDPQTALSLRSGGALVRGHSAQACLSGLGMPSGKSWPINCTVDCVQWGGIQGSVEALGTFAWYCPKHPKSEGLRHYILVLRNLCYLKCWYFKKISRKCKQKTLSGPGRCAGYSSRGVYLMGLYLALVKLLSDCGTKPLQLRSLSAAWDRPAASA